MCQFCHLLEPQLCISTHLFQVLFPQKGTFTLLEYLLILLPYALLNSEKKTEYFICFRFFTVALNFSVFVVLKVFLELTVIERQVQYKQNLDPFKKKKTEYCFNP